MKRRKRKVLCLTISIIFFLQLFFVDFSNIASADDGDTLKIETTCNAAEVFSGDEFTYTIKYSYSSTTAHDADGVVIEDELPASVQYVAPPVTSIDIESVSVVGQKVTFIFKDGLAAGTTGIVKINARFPNGITPTGTTAVNSASITCPTINGGTPIVSNDVTVVSKLNPSNWSISKMKTVPSGDPVPGTPVTYAVTITGNSGSGQLNLTNAALIDTLPAGAEFVSATGGGVYDLAANTITWDAAALGTISIGQTVIEYVTVDYPITDFTTASSVTNNLDCTASLYTSGDIETRSASCSHGFTDPVPGAGIITKTSRQTNDEYSIGQSAVFYIGNIKNTGNVPLEGFAIEDTLPAEIDVTSITTGQYNSSITVTVKYKTNKTPDWVKWGDDYINPSNTSLYTADLHLAADEYLTMLRWDFGTVPTGFSNTRNIAVYGTILTTDHDGDPVAPGATITNSAVLYASYGGSGVSDVTPVTAPVDIVAPIPWLVPTKSVVGGTSYAPGETITYNLRIKNHDYATGTYDNPVAADVLDDRFEFVPYDGGIVTWDPHDTGLTTPPVFSTGSDDLGRTVLRWTWPNGGSNITLYPGQYIDITYKVKVKDGTLAGTVPNTFYITTQPGVPFKSSTAAVDDTNHIVPTANKIVPSSANIFVKFVGTISSEMLVKGELDGVWTKAPLFGQTLPGGVADYRLTISNTSANAPIENIVIIDKLPYIGDTGVIDSSPRGSEWNPFVVNQMSIWDVGTGTLKPLPADIKVYYTTTANPSCSEFDDPEHNTGSPGDNWTEDPPDDITTVRSIKIDCRLYNGGDGLDPGDSISLYWPMRAPVGAPLDKIAWNSFGYVATYPDAGSDPSIIVQQPFLPAEPVKVGFKVMADPAATYNVGNYVWEDMDRDGIQDDGDTGLNGIIVKLYKSGDLVNYIAYTRTGDDQNGHPGYYNFPNVPAGDYVIKFAIPADYYATLKSAGADSAIDSDIDNTGQTDVFTVSGNTSDIDAGLYRKASFKGHVWRDKDADGVQDDGEDGINLVTVNLYRSSDDSFINSYITAAGPSFENGYYIFDNLDPDSYYFTVTNPNPADYVFSELNQGGDDTKDSDYNKVTGKSDPITLRSGENLSYWDAGLYRGIIGDYVWHDTNADGIQGNTETGVNDVTVRLLDSSDHEITSTKTITGGLLNKAGYYSFTDLPAGDYKIKFDLPAGYNKFSLKDMGGDETKDSDGDGTGLTGIITLIAGTINYNIDAGVYKYASVGNLVWNDINKDGIQTGETGLGGVTVNLLDSLNNPILDGMGSPLSIITPANGSYSFANLVPGSYKVQFVIPDGEYVFSTKSAPGSNINNDSNANTATGITDTFILISGQANTSIDAGMHKASFGGLVWNDLDGDGVRDGGEPAVAGVTVNLLDGSGNPVLDGSLNPITTTTNLSGLYEFDNLIHGTYKAEFVKPVNYSFTIYHSVLAAADMNSDADRTTGITDDIALAVGDRVTTYDAGVYIPVKIGNLVWEDVDGDGIQDAGENGIEGVTVILSKDGTPLGSVDTDHDGTYSFTDLAPGNYTLEFLKPADYEYATALQGGDTAKDSNTGPGAGTIAITLVSGSDNLTLDAGFYKPVSIGSIVFEDKNDNGLRDPGDTGIPGITINLYKGGVFDRTTTTDGNGIYSFSNLIPASYSVRFMNPPGYEYTAQHTGADVSIDSDADGSGDSQSFTLLSGQAIITIDCGLFRRCAIGDTVYEDTNGNGVQDAGESGIGGATVKLYDSHDTLLNTKATAADGTYSFTDLLPESYKVEFITPAGGYEPSAASKDGVITSDGKTMTLTLVSGQTNNLIDAGFYKRGSIGDYVWMDVNSNGIQDASEKGMENVTVNLYNSGNTKIATIKTDAGGLYIFSNLIPGTYTVEFVRPSGYEITPAYKGADADKDSNAGPNGRTDVALFSGENISNLDAGLYVGITCMPANLGDFVWEDLNYNGVQDPGENGMGGITVNLYNTLGAKVNTTVTDSKGHYAFLNLFPGRYSVEFEIPNGCEISLLHQGGDTEKDSNANGVGRVEGIDLSSGITDNSIDAGMYRRVCIGDRVWEDSNMNGIQDFDEKGIFGVTVSLYDINGVRIRSTVTGINGNYLFKDLLPGEYTVEFMKPEGYEFTGSHIGGTAVIDSDPNPEGMTAAIKLVSGQCDDTIDAGVYKHTGLGNRVWEDGNSNGIQDTFEKGIPMAAVNLYNWAGTKVGTTFTDSDGYYSFSNLLPGKYTVEFILPEDYMFTESFRGENIVKDSNAGQDGKTPVIELSSGKNDDTIDAGLIKLSSIGNKVWYDTNKNGILDNGEKGIPGITVNLYDISGNIVDSTVTSYDGLYLFTGLIPGTYKVGFEKPKSYEFTSELQGTDMSRNSKADRDDGMTPEIILASGEYDGIIHAGMISTVPGKPDPPERNDDKTLPKTGNGYYTYLLLGCISALLSSILMVFALRRKRKPKH